jgi:lipopolysaccharide/colanic/teichoic acid biosynthesis glycosyltransferase
MWLLTFLQASVGKGQRHAPPDVVPDTSRLLRARHYLLDGFCDVILACLFLAITLPLMIVVVLALKWESPLPVLERRTSVGRRGRRFDMLMFRTTVCDPRHLCAQRTTPLGGFIRHTRIELLPQLINVIRGEMSLINPDDRSASFFG